MHLDSGETLEHPAVHAWSKLGAGRPEPGGVESLQSGNAAQVYRLTGVGLDGSNVIAKRCSEATAFAERTVYEDVLPRVPLRSLHFYGLVEDVGTGFCWVFIEDAGGVPYSPDVAGHGRLAAEWLATLHTSALASARELHLPADRRPDRYLASLRSGRRGIRLGLGNAALAEDGRAVLAAVDTLLVAVESVWPRIEECCGVTPPTLVHGDLRARNIQVSPDGNALLPFDWESAGWGVSAVDLRLPGLDLEVYCSAIGSVWPELPLRGIQKLVVVGRLFHLLAAVEWESERLSFQWLDRPMGNMSCYLAEMSEVLSAAELL